MMRVFQNMMVVLMLWLCSCGKKQMNFESTKDYLIWASDLSNGALKSKDVNGFKLSAKYLHPEFLAIRECGTCSKSEYDSLQALYKTNLSFLVTIGPGEGEVGDVMKANVTNYAEYSERFLKMNFEFDDRVKLLNEKTTEQLLVYSLENTYGLTDHRDMYLVFSNSDSLNSPNGVVEMTVDGNLFGMGICKFRFDKADLNRKLVFDSMPSNDNMVAS